MSTRRRLVRWGSLAAFALVLAAVAATAVMTASIDVSMATVPYALVGTAVIWQRPRSRIGWVLLAFALLWSSTFFGSELAVRASSESLAVFAGWLSEWTWLPALVAVFVALPILFPTGTPISRPWAIALWVSLGMVVVFVALTSVQAQFNPVEGEAIANPFALLDITDAEMLVVPIFLPLFLLGPLAAVVRYRRARGVERRQIRWFAYGAVACGVMFAANNVVDAFFQGASTAVTELAFVAALSLPPAGIWIAVTRHQLYDIDRLISRTVSYGVLSALLAGLFVASVFLIGLVIPVEQDLPLAASTLLVAGLFNPLRRRVQEAVDKRFNRARYNAVRFVEAFSQRLHAEADPHLEAIGDKLQRAVQFTMGPSFQSLWLRDPPDEVTHARWQTASTLLPSGSLTKAP